MVTCPTIDRLYPGEILGTNFMGGSVDPQGQSGHEGVKKNLHPTNTRERTRAVQPVAKLILT